MRTEGIFLKEFFFSNAIYNGIDVIEVHTGHKSGVLVYKRYNIENKDRHPYSISKSSFEKIKKKKISEFKKKENSIFSSGTSNLRRGQYTWFDKVNLKTSGWVEDEWTKRNFRSVPGAIIRHSSYIAENVVLMPSFVNLGAYIDSGSMIDTWATVGSCAQIGKNVHLSGGAGIGGVLEPLQANPVIIEDNCFIGARSEIAEGVIVEEGSVISMGVYIGASTKVINRESGEVLFGKVPPYSVVVPGSVKSEKGDINLYCAVIVKQVDEKTRSKTSINELLRS